MRKFTNLLVALLALLGTVISARADVLSIGSIVRRSSSYILPVVLVIVVIIVAIALLRIFRKK